MIEGVSVYSFKSLFKYFPKFILRWFFTQEKLSKLIYVDLMPRNSRMTVNLCQTPNFDAYLQLINLSPFDIELDRSELKFSSCGIEVKTLDIIKKTVKSGESITLFYRENLPDGCAEHMSKDITNHQTALELHIEFNWAVRNFSKSTGRLDGIEPRFINIIKVTS